MTPTQLLTSPREPKVGRPRANPSYPRFWETDLHKMLVAGLEKVEGMVVEGRIVPSKLARDVKCCRFTVYRWLNDNRISAKGAKRIIEVSKGRLTKEDFAPFLIL